MIGAKIECAGRKLCQGDVKEDQGMYERSGGGGICHVRSAAVTEVRDRPSTPPHDLRTVGTADGQIYEFEGLSQSSLM
jgi:hypothetical protein